MNVQIILKYQVFSGHGPDRKEREKDIVGSLLFDMRCKPTNERDFQGHQIPFSGFLQCFLSPVPYR